MASKQSAKVLKKKWFNVIASPEFGGGFIGETPAYDAASLKGRVIAVNMMVLTRDPKKQNVTLSFRVSDVSGSDAKTELVKYELSSVFVKRLVKKMKDKIDDSFEAVTSDSVRVRLKPLFFTKVQTNRRKLAALRAKAREFLAKAAKETAYSDLVIQILKTELQKNLRLELKKIYPLTSCEIRLFQRL